MERRIVGSGLDPDTKLYRYMTTESFLSLIESGQLTLTMVNLWADNWEQILSKVPYVDDHGKHIASSYSFHEEVYGQCWSRVQESDAMWRIYSPSKTGIQTATSVEKFNLVGGTQKWHLEDVTYFETIPDLLEKSKASQFSPFRDALYKRSAFSHEREVRFLTHGRSLAHFEPGQAHIALPVDLPAFIEGVTIDPRADDWYVDAITKYCKRVGLAVTPTRSSLYEPDPHLKIGVTRKYVPVKK